MSTRGIALACAAVLHAPLTLAAAAPSTSPSNHALIITVSEYRRSPLPGVLTDRKLAIDLAGRFGVPPENIVELAETQVTREGLKQALASMTRSIMPGDRLYIYFSGHGARFYSKATGQCTESIVMQDMRVVTNAEFAAMLKPLSAKTDKTVVMLDSCHSGGVARAASSRELGSGLEMRPKFSAEATSPQCGLAVNDRSFTATRGADLDTTDNNLVILAAAKPNEVAWDTSKGGALTYNFQQCLEGGASDSDHSGFLSMKELTDCVQARLDKTQDAAARQHPNLAGNSGLVPSLTAVSAPRPPAGPPTAAPPGHADPAASGPPGAADPAATLNDLFAQRDDRWRVDATLSRPALKIGTNLSMTIRSERDGFVYMFYEGTQPGSFYLLFPNQLDANNSIAANQSLQLPRPEWSVTALGPHGVDHIMVMVTATARDFSAVALPRAYVSAAGPFAKIQPTEQATARIGRLAAVSAAATQAQCQGTGDRRDAGVAKQCSSAYGATLVSVEEVD
jgi:hypothetical protein